jgi:hypothetical protein
MTMNKLELAEICISFPSRETSDSFVDYNPLRKAALKQYAVLRTFCILTEKCLSRLDTTATFANHPIPK